MNIYKYMGITCKRGFFLCYEDNEESVILRTVFFFVYVCSCECGHTCAVVLMWRSEDTLGCWAPSSTLF